MKVSTKKKSWYNPHLDGIFSKNQKGLWFYQLQADWNFTIDILLCAFYERARTLTLYIVAI